MVKTYFVGKSVAVHLCNKKLIQKVPILLHTGQNECSVLPTAVYGVPCITCKLLYHKMNFFYCYIVLKTLRYIYSVFQY